MHAIEFANMTPKGQLAKLDFTKMKNFDLSKKYMSGAHVWLQHLDKEPEPLKFEANQDYMRLSQNKQNKTNKKPQHFKRGKETTTDKKGENICKICIFKGFYFLWWGLNSGTSLQANVLFTHLAHKCLYSKYINTLTTKS